ncbi:MAG: hypothetical protein JEY99_15105 [Spirochaetales bacterium]|nr:hypothetical protein [Spirochaetales bacterium]
MSDNIHLENTRRFIEEESWLRQPGETNAAFHAFCLFRDYGGDRSIRKVLEKAGYPERRISIWRAWGSRFQWKRRTTEYDNYLEKIRRQEREKAFRLREQKHLDVSEKMLDLVDKRLTKIDPQELSQGTITDWVKSAVSLERQNFEDTINTETKGNLKQLEIAFFEEFDGI